MAIEFNIENNNLENNSFVLLRTNPKLSSNLKLIVDSNSDIFLGSFKANRALSKVRYQKYDINSDGTYSNDIARFYKDIPVNERFEVLRKYSDITPFSDYEFQYEDQYNFGASFNATKLYDEQYKVFAPIWLDRQIPKKFIVYRVLDVDYSTTYTEDTTGQNSRILDLLKDATIVKTFDLTRESNIGKYLYKHVYDKSVPNSCITFNFGEEGSSEFRGIDTVNGGFASKKEFLAEDYIRKDNTEINSNQLITNGFERHGLISANLINLEFLFDDDTADNYEIYRYFGLYVDDHEEGSFEIDTISKRGIISIKPNSVTTSYNLGGTLLEAKDMLPTSDDLDLPILSYVYAGDNNYLHIKNNVSFGDLRLPIAKYTDEVLLSGFKKSKNKIPTISRKISNKAFIKFKIIEEPNLNDKFYIGDKTEIELASYSLFDFTCIADPTIPAGTFSGNRFSTKGNLNQTAIAISRLIKDITNYETHVIDTSVVVEDYANGDNRKRMSFGILQSNLNDFIKIETGIPSDIGLNNMIVPATPASILFGGWDQYTASGGSKVGASFLVKDTDFADVEINQYVKSKNISKYNRITDIVRDFKDQTTYRVIIERAATLSNDGVLQLYDKFRPTFGKFHAYSLKDFDFDFFSTVNSDLGELNYEIDNTATRNEALIATDPNSILLEDVDFDSLTPVLKTEDIDTDNNADSIFSEYDRLSENKLKETALLSRLVPTIMKFALKNGTNARNLPYVLNSNEAFGIDNLSPNIELESGRDPNNLNMEHFHFNQITDYLYADNTTTGLSSYTDFNGSGGISTNELKSTKLDYFSLYFKWNGSFNTSSLEWVDDKFKNIFTKFSDASSELDASTVFRGLRYLYKKRKEDVKASPTEFIKTTEVNDYKFGVILNYITDESIETNTVGYDVIKNDVFKFICVVLNINVVANNISSLSRSESYRAEDIQEPGSMQGSGEGVVDTVIPFNIDLTLTSNWPSLDEPINVSLFASQFAQIDGTAAFLSSITVNDQGGYSWIYFIVGQNTYGVRVVNVVSDNEITVFGRPQAFDPANGPQSGGQGITDAQIASIDISNTEFNYWQTGSAGWKYLFEEIVSYNFANRFNQYGDIKYTTITESGESTNDFVLEVQDGVSNVVPSVLQNAPDGDKPKAYQLVSTEIGKTITGRTDGGYFTILRRMNGNYNPIFKDCINFTDIYNDQCIIIPNAATTTNLINPIDERKTLIHNRFKYLGIAFSSFKNVDEDYGFIKNMYYHKVNDENSRNLLKLSETADKLPLYPEIGEIAINKRDFNVFKSKYADDYFVKSLAGGKSIKTFGTLTPTELKSFMVSTIMKVKNVYDLTSFTSTLESGIDSLDSIRFNKLNKSAIHWLENDSEIIADFYLPKAIYNELLEDGILIKFNKYVKAENSFGNKESIEDDLERYVYKNIVTRFIIDNIDVYGISGKNLDSSFVSVSSPEEIKEGGYTEQTNYEIQGYQNDGLSFRLIYNKKIGYKYNLKLHIKIQA